MGMELGGNSNTGIIDQRQDNTDDGLAVVDASALALAAVFGVVSFPPDMPEHTRAAILDRAEQIRNTSGDFIRDNQIGSRSERERQRRDEADNTDNLSLLAQIAQQQQAERDTWAHTRSTVGGVTMEGTEWADLANRLRGDDALRQEILDMFIQRGMTRDEAERRYDRMQKVAEAAAIPPSQRSEDQKHVIDEANADPTFKRDVADATSLLAEKQEAGAKPLNATFGTAASGSPAEAATTTDSPAPKVATAEMAGPGF